jgi:hypothetical protein
MSGLATSNIGYRTYLKNYLVKMMKVGIGLVVAPAQKVKESMIGVWLG